MMLPLAKAPMLNEEDEANAGKITGEQRRAIISLCQWTVRTWWFSPRGEHRYFLHCWELILFEFLSSFRSYTWKGRVPVRQSR